MVIRTLVDDLPEQIKSRMVQCLNSTKVHGMFDWDVAIQYFLDSTSPWTIRRDPITVADTKDIINDFLNFCRGILFLITNI